MKKILIILIILLCGCSNKTEEKEFKTIMQENEYVIIDVRSNVEYNNGHIENAINIPHTEINENINIDKDLVVFVYCQSGIRSQNAYNTLTNLGYTVYDLGAFNNIDLPKEY